MYSQSIRAALLLLLFTVQSLSVLSAAEDHSDHEQTTTAESHDHDGPEAHEHGADGHAEEHGEENIGDLIMNHIADANDFHVIGHFAIPLPVILYKIGDGSFTTGLSSMFHHGEHEVNGFNMDHHGRVYSTEGLNKLGLAGLGGDLSKAYIDFSITKIVFTMLLSSLILLLIFTTVAKAYKKRPGQAPKGLQSFFEPLIEFVIEDIAKPNLGHKYQKFLPFLLTVFFFIWVNNMLGLIPIFPGSANVTGNISITFTLAAFTLVLILTNANKHYWEHIFWMPGPPVPVKLLLMPIELIGVFTKPFALMVRLFANITAGHIIILSLVSMVFLLGWAGTAIAVPFGLFMNLLELLVAAVQAYIFTVLSAVFIGGAIEEAHH